jgi:hypothetical protein
MPSGAGRSVLPGADFFWKFNDSPADGTLPQDVGAKNEWIFTIL